MDASTIGQLKFTTKLALGLIALVALAFSGCATSRLSLDSTPSGAEVYVTTLTDAKPQKIGQTPMTVTSSDLEKQFHGSIPMFIEYRKPQYNPSKVLVTDLSSGDVKILLELTPQTGLEDVDSLNATMDKLFEGQRLAQAGRFDDALKILKDVQSQTPQLAAVYELQGGVYYLKKQFRESLDAYSQAAKINPKNAVAIRMRNLLEQRLGVTPKTVGANP